VTRDASKVTPTAFNRLDDLLAIAESPAERFRRVAGRFGNRCGGGPGGGLGQPGAVRQLDPTGLVVDMLAGLQPMDEMLRGSGHYGPRVTVADDADPQTQLLAFTGRHP